MRLGYEDLFRRKQEQWAHHHHHHHSANRPSQSSPIFTIDFGSEVGGRSVSKTSESDVTHLFDVIVLEISKQNVQFNSNSRKLVLSAIYCMWVIVA